MISTSSPGIMRPRMTSMPPNSAAAAVPIADMRREERVAAASMRVMRMLSRRVWSETWSYRSSSCFSPPKACTSGMAASTSLRREVTRPSCLRCFLSESLVFRYRWNRVKQRKGSEPSAMRHILQFSHHMIHNMPTIERT